MGPWRLFILDVLHHMPEENLADTTRCVSWASLRVVCVIRQWRLLVERCYRITFQTLIFLLELREQITAGLIVRKSVYHVISVIRRCYICTLIWQRQRASFERFTLIHSTSLAVSQLLLTLYGFVWISYFCLWKRNRDFWPSDSASVSRAHSLSAQNPLESFIKTLISQSSLNYRSP